MITYVVGYCFNSSFTQVVLIKKTKPAWQKDLLNGVGGKIEKDELSLAAIIREFREETGAEVTDWIQFAELAIVPPNMEHGELPGKFIDCFATVFNGEVKTTTAEEVARYDLVDLANNRFPTVPNVSWMIPMALDKLRNPHTYEMARLVYRENFDAGR